MTAVWMIAAILFAASTSFMGWLYYCRPTRTVEVEKIVPGPPEMTAWEHREEILAQFGDEWRRQARAEVRQEYENSETGWLRTQLEQLQLHIYELTHDQLERQADLTKSILVVPTPTGQPPTTAFTDPQGEFIDEDAYTDPTDDWGIGEVKAGEVAATPDEMKNVGL